MLPNMAPLMEQVVAEALRGVRGTMELSQDQLAAKMRFLGFLDWSRATVAAVETGRRRVTLGEVFGIARVLEIPVWSLLVWNHDRVALANNLETSAASVRQMLKTAKDSEAFRVTMNPDVADMDRISNTQADLCLRMAPKATQQMLLQAARGELEQTIGRRYLADEDGEDPSEGWPIVAAAAAHCLYDGRSATEERDARATTPDSRQHVSRAIAIEIVGAVDRARREEVWETDRRFPGRPGAEKGRGE